MPESCTVLLVEDNRGDVRLVRDTFAECGIPARLEVVENAVQAFSYLQRQGVYADRPLPDLILLDLNLPIIDGHKAMSIIRSSREWGSIPIVVLTSSARTCDRDISVRLGARAYEIKPTVWSGYLDLGKRLKRLIEEDLVAC